MRDHRVLIGIVLLFFAVRLLYPVLLVPPVGFYDSEELVRGTLAYDLIHGLKLPFWEYLGDYYSGGSVIVGILAVPFFLLFGPSLFSLRLVALLFSLSILLAWYLFARRNLNPRAAHFISFFFVLPPPVYLMDSSLAMGFHTESMLFSAVAFILLFEILDHGRTGFQWPACLGLMLGFGSWFCYTTLVSAAIVLIWWFWCDHRMILRKQFAFFALFFTLGFSPWIPANLQQHFRGLEFLEAGLRYNYISGIPETAAKIVKTTLWTLPTLFTIKMYVPNHFSIWNLIYSAIFGISLLYLLLREYRATSLWGRPPSNTFPIWAGILYVVLVSFTRYNLASYGSSYLLAMLPFLFCTTAIVLSDLSGRGIGQRCLATAILGLGMIAGGYGLINLLDFRWPGASFRMPGYSYPELAESLYLRHLGDYTQITRLLQAVKPELTPGDLSEFLRHVEFPYGYEIDRERAFAVALQLAHFPPDCRAIGYFRLGIAIQSSFDRSTDSFLEWFSRQCPPEYAGWISEGIQIGRLFRIFGRGQIPGNINRLPLNLGSDTRILFLNGDTFDLQGEIGWVAGECWGSFLIESSRMVSDLSVRLANGDRPNSVTLATDGEREVFDLAPGQSLSARINLGPAALMKDKRYWRFSVESRFGHFPILTRGGPDARYLGVRLVSILPHAP